MPEDVRAARTGAPHPDRWARAPTRRRALRVIAAVSGLPLLIAALRATAPKAQFYSWNGEVLGAVSELTLWHTDAAFAQRTIHRMRHEIARLERIFSLYRPDSEISRLNEAGRLTRPSAELRALVDESHRLGALSGGAFDISVQPLWRLYEEHFWSRTAVQSDLAARARDLARALVHFRQIDCGAAAISFARSRIAIPLHPIAHGSLTALHAPLTP